MTSLVSLLAALLLAAPGEPEAQTFPIQGKPIRVLVGFAAGGSTDIQARLLQPHLAKELGVPVIIENRPGASTMLAAQEVARAAPDGHTILYSFSGAFAQNPHTFAHVPYDPLKDFTPISLASRGPLVLVAHSSLGVNNVKELIAYARANPGKLNYASFGTGTSSHLFGELLARQTGIDLVHVPYKGTGDAMKDLFAGRVHLMFDAAPTAVQNAAAGRVKILGVVAEKRVALLPAVPTITEQGLTGIDVLGWLGFFGPAKMSPATVKTLNAAIAKALASPEVKEGFAKGIYEATPSSPEELGAIVRTAYDRWGTIVKQLGFKPQ
jgi:tripartite-type tricarboxylate transporter receptor subunit TctC